MKVMPVVCKMMINNYDVELVIKTIPTAEVLSVNFHHQSLIINYSVFVEGMYALEQWNGTSLPTN